MASNLVSNTLSVLAGASLGAIATYLLDPDTGDRRRGQIRSAAEDAVSGTSEKVSSHLHKAVEAARSVAGRLTEYAGELAHHAGDVSNGVSTQLNGAVEQARSVHDDLTDRAIAAFGRAKKSALDQAGLHESQPLTTGAEVAVGVIAFAAAGAGMMYFLDPDRGRARRAMATDKVSSWARKTGHSARGYGRHISNRLKGVAHDVQASVPDCWPESVEKAADSVTSVVANESPAQN